MEGRPRAVAARRHYTPVACQSIYCLSVRNDEMPATLSKKPSAAYDFYVDLSRNFSNVRVWPGTIKSVLI